MKLWTQGCLDTLSTSTAFNVGERNLVLRIKKMLIQANEGKVLDNEDFGYLEHKIFVRSFCFEERYGGMYRHLKRYHDMHES